WIGSGTSGPCCCLGFVLLPCEGALVTVMEKTILAIDPGTRKCGFALVQRNTEGKLSLLWRTIKPTEEASDAMHEAMNVANYSMVVVGKGTSSKELVSKLREEFPSIGVLMVDEENTS